METPPEPTAVVVVIDGTLRRADLRRLCERARDDLERARTEAVVCDVASLERPDAVAVDALARLQLTAQRAGRRLRLRGASHELLELIELAGLSAVLGVEAERQPEEREQVLGVEEERELRDPGP